MRESGVQYLNLDTRYSVGDRIFDEQHYHILQILDKLFTSIENKQENGSVNTLLDDFVNKTKEHFALEEETMKNVEYPSFWIHKNLHDSFVNKIMLYRRNYLDGNLSFASEKVAFFRRWFKDHILETDKLYSAFINDRVTS
jgi:hemerythrin-like metal-binding protein